MTSQSYFNCFCFQSQARNDCNCKCNCNRSSLKQNPKVSAKKPTLEFFFFLCSWNFMIAIQNLPCIQTRPEMELYVREITGGDWIEEVESEICVPLEGGDLVLGIGWEIRVAEMVEPIGRRYGLGKQIAIFAAHFRTRRGFENRSSFWRGFSIGSLLPFTVCREV